MTRVLVCGGRDCDPHAVADWLERRAEDVVGSPIRFVIEGAARGADTGAFWWRNKHLLHGQRFPADWGLHGRRAGYIRNAQMLDEGKPDVVIAFPGGKGTEMMVRLALKAGVRVIHARAYEATVHQFDK